MANPASSRLHEHSDKKKKIVRSRTSPIVISLACARRGAAFRARMAHPLLAITVARACLCEWQKREPGGSRNLSFA
jgi:hypothetical protein